MKVSSKTRARLCITLLVLAIVAAFIETIYFLWFSALSTNLSQAGLGYIALPFVIIAQGCVLSFMLTVGLVLIARKHIVSRIIGWCLALWGMFIVGHMTLTTKGFFNQNTGIGKIGWINPWQVWVAGSLCMIFYLVSLLVGHQVIWAKSKLEPKNLRRR